jgi:peptidoglycan biosynthesis protein MviN/MurJ (putative lipid II flippase)
LLIFLSLLLFVFSPFLINWVAPGFSPGQKELAVLLTRLLLVSPILFGLSSILSGVLQYFNRFWFTGFVRFSLTLPTERIELAAQRLSGVSFGKDEG